MAKDDLLPKCGIVMPISAIDGCSEGNWSDVQDILSEGISAAEFEPNLVSNSDEVGIIHKRIIQNLYDNPIVVCDVSGKNPNVMFELGLRLAFDKPTIVVKDSETSYSFDTSPIEHLEYPRDLRFSKIVEFKKNLALKLCATYKKSTSDPNYTTFLKHFGEFKVAKLDEKEVSGQEFILEELKSIRQSVRNLERPSRRTRAGKNDEGERHYQSRKLNADVDVCMNNWPEDRKQDATELALATGSVVRAERVRRFRGHEHLLVFAPQASVKSLHELEQALDGCDPWSEQDGAGHPATRPESK